MYRDLVLGIHSHVMYRMNGITIVNTLNMFINLMVQNQQIDNSIMKHIYIVGRIINYLVLLIMMQLLINSGGKLIQRSIPLLQRTYQMMIHMDGIVLNF
jgi:hypothetical protein